MSAIFYMTKGRLITAMEVGRINNYNQRVSEETINSLDPAYHYPVVAAIPHEHKQGVRCKPHVRLLVEVRTRSGSNMEILVDIPAELCEKYLSIDTDSTFNGVQ